jgi:hypothetical protein
MKILSAGIDQAALYGTRTGGQPVGLTLAAGVGSFSGASLAIGGLTGAFVSLGNALGNKGRVAANRTTAGLLRQRPETAGSTKILWSGTLTAGTVIDYPARSSVALSSGNLIVGSWEISRHCGLGWWNQACCNHYSDSVTGTASFVKDLAGYRAMASIDVGTVWPAAFTVAASIT